MKIAQALQKTWQEGEDDRKLNHPNQPKTPLEYYLQFNYTERYVTLCNRLGITPQSLGKWLFKDIDSVR